MDISTLGFGAAFLMGLVFGAGPCTITCLPYLGPVFLAGEGEESWTGRTSAFFRGASIGLFDARRCGGLCGTGCSKVV